MFGSESLAPSPQYQSRQPRTKEKEGRRLRNGISRRRKINPVERNDGVQLGIGVGLEE